MGDAAVNDDLAVGGAGHCAGGHLNVRGRAGLAGVADHAVLREEFVALDAGVVVSAGLGGDVDLVAVSHGLQQLVNVFAVSLKVGVQAAVLQHLNAVITAVQIACTGSACIAACVAVGQAKLGGAKDDIGFQHSGGYQRGGLFTVHLAGFHHDHRLFGELLGGIPQGHADLQAVGIGDDQDVLIRLAVGAGGKKAAAGFINLLCHGVVLLSSVDCSSAVRFMCFLSVSCNLYSEKAFPTFSGSCLNSSFKFVPPLLS